MLKRNDPNNTTVNIPLSESTGIDITTTELQKQLASVVKEHGSESNIPVHHDYWRLLNVFRVFHSKK